MSKYLDVTITPEGLCFLYDRFAGDAMKAGVASFKHSLKDIDLTFLAKMSYETADAMMERREALLLLHKERAGRMLKKSPM